MREALATDMDLGVISIWLVASDKKQKQNNKGIYCLRTPKGSGVLSSASDIAGSRCLHNSTGFLPFF